MSQTSTSKTIDSVIDLDHINIPGVPVSTAYTLTYRVGVMSHCEKGFTHKGDLRSAIVRAREHCERMGYTFKFCRPLIVDLDEEEKTLRSQV